MPKAPKKKVNQAAIALDPINAAAFLRATKATEAAAVGTPVLIPRPVPQIKLKTKTGGKEKPKRAPNLQEKTSSRTGPLQTKPELKVDQQQETESAPEKEAEATARPEWKPEPVIITTVVLVEPSKPVPRGHETVIFQNTTDWTARFERNVGYKTRSITLGSRFVLEDEHINHLLSLGPRVCQTLQHFRFEHQNIDDDWQNRFDASDDSTMRLAEACPGLKEVQIQGATKLTDGAVWAFLANCPLLTRLEVSSHYKRKIRLEGGFFTSLQHRVDLATELEILRVDGNVPYGGTNRFATAMRALSKARETLLIEISRTSEDSQYYWGDGRSYFMTVSDDKFKRGRKL